ncbi:30S ribosomal protein S3 [Candidatus Woesearchaeota archaeon]|nr:30S ribosomal protein S3 [Candidatus Woesearchaeota archaeon]
MIERQFISQNMKEYLVQEYIAQNLKNVGLSHTKLVKTPAGIKIIIYASRPGLIVGRKGANIKELTLTMKNKFKLENPQIEIAEVPNINLDPFIVAEKIASTIERFGTQRFKGIAHKIMSDVLGAGARGIELLISGKIPSARAKSWRFSAGYLKKCGDIAVSGVKKAISSAKLKTGTIGVQVKIMPPDIKLPDDITIYDEKTIEENSAAEKKAEEIADEKKRSRKSKKPRQEHKEHKKEKKSAPKQIHIQKEEHKEEVQKKQEIKQENKTEHQGGAQ